MTLTLADVLLPLLEEGHQTANWSFDPIAWTNEDATQTGLAGQQGYDNRVVAPEQVKLTELGVTP